MHAATQHIGAWPTSPRRGRRPRGYWLPGGEGHRKVGELVGQGMTRVKIANELDGCYSVVARISAQHGRKVKRRNASEMSEEKRLALKLCTAQDKDLMLRAKDTQEIDWTDAPIFKRYGPADAYASCPPHRSRSEGMR